MQKKKLYLIAGLAADRTVFSELNLSGYEVVYLDWIKPFKNESLESYALRLAERIEEPDAVIIGLSMGGMIASEILRANPAMRAIIISSNRTRNEIPAYTRFVSRYVPLYKLTTRLTMRMVFPITRWVLGTSSREETKRLWSLINRVNIPFFKWCIYSIARWKMTEPQPNVIHIHGTADRLLPYRLVKPDYTIKGGGHLMVRDRAEEVSALIRHLLS